MAVFDINNFKELNDLFRYNFGDSLLVMFANELRSAEDWVEMSLSFLDVVIVWRRYGRR